MKKAKPNFLTNNEVISVFEGIAERLSKEGRLFGEKKLKGIEKLNDL